MITKYRIKPMIVEAVKWNGKNFHSIKSFAGNKVFLAVDNSVHCRTFTGLERVNLNDFIVKGIDNEFTILTKKQLDLSYEEII